MLFILFVTRSQHIKNISASTTAGLSAARFFETTSPAFLKICSLGTDVGGAANTLAARFRTRCYRFSFSFHHINGSSVKPIGASLLSC